MIGAFGALAIAPFSIGGCALGWQAAEGGIAVAHPANDAPAKAGMNTNAFIQAARHTMNRAALLNVVWFVPLLLLWHKGRRVKRQTALS